MEITKRKSGRLDVSTDGESIGANLDAFGYAVVAELPVNTDQSSRCLQLAWMLGDIACHERSDASGTTDVITAAMSKTKLDNAVFRGLSAGSFPPHTDGSFLNVVKPVGPGIVGRIGPPKALVIECIVPALDGGESVLVDAGAAIRDIIEEDEDLFEQLTKPWYLFCRGERSAVSVPIISQSGNAKWRIRVRLDGHCSGLWPHGHAALSKLKHRLTSNDYTTTLKLGVGEMLVIDNFRVLHGRTAVADQNAERHLRRVWVADDEVEMFANEVPMPANQGCLDASVGYRTLPAPVNRSERIVWAAGMRLG